ncbi:Putative mitochondrial chaperone bcs1 [Glycine soja]|nr:Putative mitochondrial chaperone bcs1 [Glycine soja]
MTKATSFCASTRTKPSRTASLVPHSIGSTKKPNRTGFPFVLQIRKTDKRRILRQYLRHIDTIADEMNNQSKRHLRLFMNAGAGGGTRWRSVPFNHPATFETMAMEKDLKNKIKSDLESFLKAKQYYRKLGRAWKRSYLLYGASGTGKSSFVAAMANFLRYDVYDVDLSKIRGDSDLKFLLTETTAKSTLASSYLGVREHKLFAQVEDIFRHGATLSPAEISELMIANRNSPSRAIKSVIGALQSDGEGRRSYADSIGRRIEGDDVDEAPCGGDGFSTVKDLRKFYGFFKLRNPRRTSQQSNSSPHDR